MKKIISSVIAVAILFLFFSPAHAASKDLTEEITGILENNNTTTASIALIEADDSWHTLGIGFTDKSMEKPVDEHTLFRIGSVSKIFTALAVLKLVEEGKLGLNDPVRGWAKDVEFNNPWESEYPVRIVHLLSHTAGWDDMHMSEYAHNDPTPIALQDSFSVYPQSRTSRWVPGTRMAYSNSGTGVAAYIVEICTGQPYEDYIETNFFQPLGMTTATFFQSDHYLVNGVTLYHNDDEQPYWHIIMRPSGAINASASDMIQLLNFFINSADQPALTEDSIAAMRKPNGSALAESGLEVGYGLAHFTETDNGFTWHGHNGGVNGGLSDFKYIPELGIGYYFAINSDSGLAFLAISELLKDHLTTGLTPPVTPFTADATVNTEELASYYRAANPRNSSLYFIEYLVAVAKIETRPEGIALIGILDGSEDLFSPVNEKQYVDSSTGKISLAVSEDPILGTVLLTEWFTLKPVSFLSVYGPLVFLAIWQLATLVTIIKSIILLFFRLRKKPVRGGLWLHLLLLLQILSIGLFVWGFIGVATVNLLADNRLISALMAYGSIAFFLLSAATIIWLLIKRERHYNYFHSLVYSFMNLIIAIYLTNMGVMGYHFF